MTNRSRAAHVRRARHRLSLVAVASLWVALPSSPRAARRHKSPRPSRAQVVALLKRTAAELARDDQLVSVVQVLPTPRGLRHGAESPNASKLLATERADGPDRRDDSRLMATLTGDERRLMGDARSGEIAAFNRARHLLELRNRRTRVRRHGLGPRRSRHPAFAPAPALDEPPLRRVGCRRGSTVGTPRGGEPRRLVHLRRRRPLGRQ